MLPMWIPVIIQRDRRSLQCSNVSSVPASRTWSACFFHDCFESTGQNSIGANTVTPWVAVSDEFCYERKVDVGITHHHLVVLDVVPFVEYRLEYPQVVVHSLLI